MKSFKRLFFAIILGTGVFMTGGQFINADSNVTLGIPTDASITSGNDTIYGRTATDYWSISWGGGNGTYYVDFDDDNGGGYYNPSANFTSYSNHSTYYLRSSETENTWHQTLYVSSAGGGSSTDSAYVTQRRN